VIFGAKIMAEPDLEAHNIGNRCPSCRTARFPDPKGRESATPFPWWLSVHLCLCRWRRHPRLGREEFDEKDLRGLRGIVREVFEITE
jgi:hypothetical protein